MGIKINEPISAKQLQKNLVHLFELAGQKITSLHEQWDASRGTPVFTVRGEYTSRGWTEWTQGFQYGMALLQFDATGEHKFLELGRKEVIKRMASHVSHVGVHDHGFNNVSTYGNLLRLMRQEKTPFNEAEKDFYELALKVSGAVQAARWTAVSENAGYIYSFNGPHSLFIDTMRSLRSLAVAHALDHVLMGERDRRICLLDRLIQHATLTARHAIYYGEGRDAYDIRGRTAHESVFNLNDGSYRCPNSQQGYSPFSTWTRGLAWALCGFAEELEFFDALKPVTSQVEEARPIFEKAALAVADFYIDHTPACGVPMWDTGAPLLHRLGDFLDKPADPYNQWEPVDSSAAAIAAQGFLRLGSYLANHQNPAAARYTQAGLTIAKTILDRPYLSESPRHQGLLLHSVYHRPNGWDHIAPGQKVPNGESSLWGDYHLMELGVMLLRELRNETPLSFFSCVI